MTHNIPIGSLVEISYDGCPYEGVRLFVVAHRYDCDKTPLYCLSYDKEDTEYKDSVFENRGWIGGFDASSLTIIK